MDGWIIDVDNISMSIVLEYQGLVFKGKSRKNVLKWDGDQGEFCFYFVFKVLENKQLLFYVY